MQRYQHLIAVSASSIKLSPYRASAGVMIDGGAGACATTISQNLRSIANESLALWLYAYVRLHSVVLGIQRVYGRSGSPRLGTSNFG
jgi:hypothetical protein